MSHSGLLSEKQVCILYLSIIKRKDFMIRYANVSFSGEQEFSYGFKQLNWNGDSEQKANMIFCVYGDAILPGDDTGFGWSGAYGGGYSEHVG